MPNLVNHDQEEIHEYRISPNTAEMDIEQLYQRHFHDVYQFCYYFTNRQSEAEDLTQETFLKAMKAIDRFQAKSSYLTWLLSIARHTAIDSIRRKKWLLLSFSKFREEAASLTSADTKRIEDLDMIGQALQSLKPHLRATVILRGLKELSVKETASILNCSDEKVRVDYHRALKTLRQLLSDQEKGGDAL